MSTLEVGLLVVLLLLLVAGSIYVLHEHKGSLAADLAAAKTDLSTGLTNLEGRITQLLHVQHQSVTTKIAALPAIPTNQPAALPGPAAGPVITPVTPQECVDACLKASVGSGGYRNGMNWNQLAFLKAMDPKAFAGWCAALAALPACAQELPAGVVADVLNSASAGWIKGLSQQGQGIVLSVASAGLVIPDVDPRA